MPEPGLSFPLWMQSTERKEWLNVLLLNPKKRTVPISPHHCCLEYVSWRLGLLTVEGKFSLVKTQELCPVHLLHNSEFHCAIATSHCLACVWVFKGGISNWGWNLLAQEFHSPWVWQLVIIGCVGVFPETLVLPQGSTWAALKIEASPHQPAGCPPIAYAC